jgi:hypothetical protein
LEEINTNTIQNHDSSTSFLLNHFWNKELKNRFLWNNLILVSWRFFNLQRTSRNLILLKSGFLCLSGSNVVVLKKPSLFLNRYNSVINDNNASKIKFYWCNLIFFFLKNS